MLDRNTTQYMIDEMQAKMDNRKKKLGDTQEKLTAAEKRIAELEKILAKKSKCREVSESERGAAFSAFPEDQDKSRQERENII